MPIAASVSGRLCLAGENIDWMTGPVIAVALSQIRVRVEVDTGRTGAVSVQYAGVCTGSELVKFNGHLSTESPSGHYIGACIRVLEHRGHNVNNISILVQSSLPVSGGLSSSSTLCVALVAALSKYLGEVLSPFEVARLAYMAEHDEMGIQCGQMDQYAVCAGGACFLDCSSVPPQIQKLFWRGDVVAVVGCTDSYMPFAESAVELQRRWKYKEPTLMQYIRHTEDAIATAKNLMICSQWNPVDVGRLINSCQSYITDYKRIANPLIDRYIEAARRAGAYCAKSAGARSMGGSMFALCPPDYAGDIANAIAACGGRTIISEVDHRGIIYE